MQNSSQLAEIFRINWVQKKFASNYGIVLLGVSGGSDSMVMVDLCLNAKIPFAIAHCNFQLRGEEANKDEELVCQCAAQNKIMFHSIRFDTMQKAIEWKKGIEETARILRYEWFENLLSKHQYAKIATAHHANDNIETLLMNLFKGTGIGGLHGIPESNGNIIRPLLFAQKDELLEYAAANYISYRDDASNASDHYLRNAVRHHIVPVAKKWFPHVIKNVSESINRFSQVEVLYRQAIEVHRNNFTERRGDDYYILISKFKQCAPLETVCYELFVEYHFSSRQVRHILSLLTSESGHYVDSATHRIIRDRDFLIVTQKPINSDDFIIIDVPSNINIGGNIFTFSITDRPIKFCYSKNSALIDLEKITFPLTVRKWKFGDYFYPLGMKMKKKKLSDFFIDNKLPLHEKENIWLLESGNNIVWIIGLRLDERVKITEKTKQVLEITVN